MSRRLYDLHQAIDAIGGELESSENVFEIAQALLRVGLVKATDYVEHARQIRRDVQGEQSALMLLRVFHRHVRPSVDGRTAVPAPHLNSGLEAQGASSDRGLKKPASEGPFRPSPSQAPFYDGCDCGLKAPCYSSECYHPWRRAMVMDTRPKIRPGIQVRDRLDISQHK